MRKTIIIVLSLVLLVVSPLVLKNFMPSQKSDEKKTSHLGASILKIGWEAPDTSSIEQSKEGDLIRYGRKLILYTGDFLGPKGSIAQISNGMNCGNCHIDAGTRLWGNNFSMVASSYPLFRSRSGKKETIEMRINDCFERSLNGKKLKDTGMEMAAIKAYIKWVGKGVPNGMKTEGSGIEKLPFMNKAADTLKGKWVYLSTCQRCHGKNGEGRLNSNGRPYLYPPLWGKNSFNIGAGMYQLSKFAGYVKNNMPFGTTYKIPILTNEQAWDVAAYVNSRPRPNKDLEKDWPDISTKPVDYPFGPYSDTFSVRQHKFGTFGPIQEMDKK